jgi:hypothetical protein
VKQFQVSHTSVFAPEKTVAPIDQTRTNLMATLANTLAFAIVASGKASQVSNVVGLRGR